MILSNLFAPHARKGGAEASSDDRSIMLLVVLLLGLVFAPVIGLHIAAVFFTTPDSLADHAMPTTKPTRS